jgi:hypothetical protein
MIDLEHKPKNLNILASFPYRYDAEKMMGLFLNSVGVDKHRSTLEKVVFTDRDIVLEQTKGFRCQIFYLVCEVKK